MAAVALTMAAVMAIALLTGRLWLGPLSILAAVIVIRIALGLRGLDFRELGLVRPRPWIRTLLLGIGCWFVVFLVNGVIINPVIYGLLGETPRLEIFDGLRGNAVFYAQLLLLSWTVAAFGEEILFRGYLLTRVAGLFGGGPRARLAALTLQAAAFGAAHLYQGLAGVLVTGSVGFVLGALYLMTRRNLWAVIVAHGLVDTVSLTALYLGLDGSGLTRP